MKCACLWISETPPTSQSYGGFASNLKSQLTSAYWDTHEQVGTRQWRQEYFNRGVKEATYEPGHLVFLVNMQLKVGEASKFHQNWKGPYEVKEHVTKVIYRILKLGDPPSCSKIVHFNNLKLHQQKKEIHSTVQHRRKPAPTATAKPDYHGGEGDGMEEQCWEQLEDAEDVESQGSGGEQEADMALTPDTSMSEDPGPSHRITFVPEEGIPQVQDGDEAEGRPQRVAWWVLGNKEIAQRTVCTCARLLA